MTHELKTWPEYFEKVLSGEKTFEVRNNDRSFQLDDLVLLLEYDPKKEKYSGNMILKEISYILNGPGFGIEDGYCVLGLRNITANKEPKLSDEEIIIVDGLCDRIASHIAFVERPKENRLYTGYYSAEKMFNLLWPYVGKSFEAGEAYSDQQWKDHTSGNPNKETFLAELLTNLKNKHDAK